ncbi:MAG: hypothetical protein V2I66_12115, partial [Halieaceae bacterium]|nr:hypothetical protein [Halieaceae bacterium]
HICLYLLVKQLCARDGPQKGPVLIPGNRHRDVSIAWFPGGSPRTEDAHYTQIESPCKRFAKEISKIFVGVFGALKWGNCRAQKATSHRAGNLLCRLQDGVSLACLAAA